MSLLSTLRSWFGVKSPSERVPINRTPIRPTARALAGGRASQDTSDTFITAGWIVVPPSDYESNWRTLNLDAKTLDRMSPAKLLEMLADLSPEVARAQWDFLRLCNPGWEAEALKEDGETQDEAAQAATDAFLDQLADYYGSIDVVWGRLFISGFFRGAFAGELVLDAAGRMPVDFATPDPHSLRFRKRQDDVRGQVWQLGQWQAGEFVPLDRETIRYVPVDPFPGSPYGRPLASPALFTSLFLLGMLHDLRRVVQQQGYPRMDLSIDTEKLLQATPDLIEDGQSFKNFVQEVVDMVQGVYEQLEPDDAYIHTDHVTVNRPVGVVDSSSLGAIDGLITALERMATRALKTMPLLMGMAENVSETQSNRMWEIHVAGIKSLQHYAETLIGRLLTLALEAQGMQAEVKFRFSELRAAEMLRDAQTEMLQIQNAEKKYQAGWVSQDEVSEEITGHPADVPEPRMPIGGFQFIQDDGDGQERVLRRRYRPITRVKLIPDGADDPLTPVPDEVEISDADEERALDEWDKLMPDEAGLLDATVEGQTDFDDENRARQQVRQRDTSPWIWSQSAKRYRNTETGRFIGQRQMTELRDAFVDAKREVAGTLANRLANGEITVQQWELDMRRHVKTTFLDEYVLGKGGRNNMTQADWGASGRMIRDQYDRLHSFAEDIAAGNLSQAQITARSRLYFNSATQAFERGRSASYGVPTLPEYPADGSQICLSNCRCRWSIAETDTTWECTWVLNSAAEHCDTCVGNADRWNPLVIGKDGRSREQIEKYLETLRNGDKVTV